MGQIASRALLNRCGEDVAPSAEKHAFTFRAERDVFNKVCDLDPAWSTRESVVGNVDGDSVVLLRFGVEDAKLAVKFVNYATVARSAGPADVPRTVAGNRRDFAACDVVGIKIEVPVAI